MRVFTKTVIRLVAVTMAIAMVTVMTGCVVEPPVMKESEYTITVTNRAGTPLEKCKVDVYTDESMTGVVHTGITDKNGQIRFTDVTVSKYVAAVSKVHSGYAVAEYYPLTGERTDIVLSAGVLTDDAMNSVKYSLGDPVMDFSVSTPEGEVTLSELLMEKKAVVLNFWFLNCDPCKMEFPYIQEGYEQVQDDVAVLALNPYDGTQDEVSTFREQKGYTFIMSKCDERWSNMMKIQSYPTTVVIDRFGNICLIHNGMLRSTQDFLDMVGYFIADDYQQQFFKSAGQIPAA